MANVRLYLGEGGKEGEKEEGGEGGRETPNREVLAWMEGAKEEVVEALVHAVVECLEA